MSSSPGMKIYQTHANPFLRLLSLSYLLLFAASHHQPRRPSSSCSAVHCSEFFVILLESVLICIVLLICGLHLHHTVFRSLEYTVSGKSLLGRKMLFTVISKQT